MSKSESSCLTCKTSLNGAARSHAGGWRSQACVTDLLRLHTGLRSSRVRPGWRLTETNKERIIH